MDFYYKIDEKPKTILNKDIIFQIPKNSGFYKCIYTISSLGQKFGVDPEI